MMEPVPATSERIDDTPRIEILVVDEHLIFREGLRKLLEGEPGFTVVGDASSPGDALRAVEAHKPHIVIVSLAGRSLVRLLQALHLGAEHHPARRIVLATAIERRHIVQAMELGVSGMLLKDTSAQLMFESVRAVAAGHCWIGREQFTDLAQVLVRPAPISKTRFRLTPRELEIVDAVRRGDTNKTIARQLSITENTVKHHLTTIFGKVGVFTRLQLAVFAINHKLERDPGVLEDAAMAAAL
jgi:two-component system, NarL family, nitrate/nitrite response regulator NarL